tara:strand:- start:1113 stop:1292 length:180 start_codon:yes stop_codon:yes gene_type:complete
MFHLILLYINDGDDPYVPLRILLVILLHCVRVGYHSVPSGCAGHDHRAELQDGLQTLEG